MAPLPPVVCLQLSCMQCALVLPQHCAGFMCPGAAIPQDSPARQQSFKTSQMPNALSPPGFARRTDLTARLSSSADVSLIGQVHDNPVASPVDAPTQWPLRNLRRLLEELVAIARVSRGLEDFRIDLLPVGEDFDPSVSA